MNGTEIFNRSMIILNEDHILWLINEKEYKKNIPAIVFLFFTVVLGTIGNGLVIYVFGWRMHRVSKNIFIMWLAVFDLISCCVTAPYEIFDLRFPIIYGEPVTCKLFRTIAFASNMNSCLILLFIAFDRNQITKPPYKGYTRKKTRCLILLAILISLILSAPAPVIFGTKEVQTSFPWVTGIDCSFDDLVSGTIYPTLYYSLLAVIFIITFIILGVLYVKIAIAIWTWKHTIISDVASYPSHKKDSIAVLQSSSVKSKIFNFKLFRKKSSVSSISFTDITDETGNKNCLCETIHEENTRCDSLDDVDSTPTHTDFNEPLGLSQVKKEFCDQKPGSYERQFSCSSSKSCKHSSKYHSCSTSRKTSFGSSISESTDGKGKRKQSIKERASIVRTNALFVTITVVFVMSYLPFLLLEVLKRVLKDELFNEMAFEFVTKSVYLNNVFNPIIYGVFNDQYRREIWDLFCKRRPRKSYDV